MSMTVSTFSTREVADSAGVSVNRIHTWISRGILTAPRKTKNGRYAWRKRDLSRLNKALSQMTS